MVIKVTSEKGAAVGTKFAPPYSNLFMAGLEKGIFQNSEFKPFLWLRYLDDISCIWTQGFQKLNEFFNCIKSLHLAIKFTMRYSTTEINFLDVTVTKVGNNHVAVNVYKMYCIRTDCKDLKDLFNRRKT